MVKVSTRLTRIGLILGLLAILGTGTSLEPRQVLARPAGTGGPDGEPYGTGDPTGDDIPSPTPKPTVLKAAPVAGTLTQGRGRIDSRDRWNVYLSILIRLGIR